MAIHQNIYTIRNRKPIEVFTYDSIPQELKIQLSFIWKKFFKQLDLNTTYELWERIYQIICEAEGKEYLATYGHEIIGNENGVFAYFKSCTDVNKCLFVIHEVLKSIVYIPEVIEILNLKSKIDYKPEEVILDVNSRFLEHGIGFEFRNREFIRIDNKLLHQDVIIPTLYFLSEPEFHNANDEYLSAHKHFRHGRTKECLNDCLKALETTLKIICHQNGWVPERGETAKHLLDLCFQHGLIPTYLTNHFSGLRSTLESGVPTLRNKLGGHGQGTQRLEVPMHYASYMLYLTGTTINFLVSCHQELKPTA